MNKLQAKIVLVDDEVDFRSSLALLLEAHGHEVHEAGSALEAWTLIETQRPHVVVTDLMMPRLSGLDLCRRVRADPQFEALPIVMLSAAPAPELGYGVWVDRYLTKPAPLDEVLQAVQDVLTPTEPATPSPTPAERPAAP